MPRTNNCNKYKHAHNKNLYKNNFSTNLASKDFIKTIIASPKLSPIPESPTSTLASPTRSITSTVREIIDDHFALVMNLVENDEEKYWVFVDRLTAESEKELQR